MNSERTCFNKRQRVLNITFFFFMYMYMLPLINRKESSCFKDCRHNQIRKEITAHMINSLKCHNFQTYGVAVQRVEDMKFKIDDLFSCCF